MSDRRHWLEGQPVPTAAQVIEYRKLSPLFSHAFKEIKEFAKKKPDGVMSELKVKLLNRRLTELKDAMVADPKAEYLDLLDETSLPDYSDAVLILSQYEAVIASFSSRFQGRDSHTDRFETRWFTEESPPKGQPPSL